MTNNSILRTPNAVAKLRDSLIHSPFMANLTAALENKTSIALILGLIDNAVTIRETFGVVSLDHVLPIIEGMLHERFGDHSVGWGTIFLIVVTGDKAAIAGEIAESIRAAVETMNPALDERFHVTMHFGVTPASSKWTSANGLDELIAATDEAICVGQQKLLSNRVYVSG
jgi:PleD family two-component response regulator